MPRPMIPAAVLADRGKPLTLTNPATGEPFPVRLFFGFQALMQIEEEFGSLAAAIALIDKAEEGAAFTSIARMLACGLAHETGDHGSLGTVAVLGDYLDPADIGPYAEAMGAAIQSAFPSAAPADEDADPSSLGASGTTSPVSASASQTTSSGE